ncbi:DNA cytosine methyltransferase [Methanococcus voltae]|uniref:DNA (cytosine-5-)-methyltransferase n=1 Tax=Methanococcus voltae (strain ATCC BAA-1334 / A3) TaxID=456320 RepID=D7DQF0_METV3|nr:DNA cytosine methyltransferase [Methanococcus voltae]MCS3901689.1 DNA (cytosine-5)-methyltransferase 1 [Methanococcus voltae]
MLPNGLKKDSHCKKKDNETSKNEKNHFTFVDLFCGCGGFSRGFIDEGFNPLVAIEIEENPVSSYALNFNGKIYEKIYKNGQYNYILKENYFKLEDFMSKEEIDFFKKINNYDKLSPIILNEDIREIHSLDILKFIDDKNDNNLGNIRSLSSNNIDLLIGGPPCEGYTGANPKRLKNPYDRLYSDELGRLVLEYIRIVGDLKPKVFVMENVPGMLNWQLWECIEQEFAKVGYNEIYFHVFNAENFGNPSVRKRIIVSNIKLNPEWSEHKNIVRDILEDEYTFKTIKNVEKLEKNEKSEETQKFRVNELNLNKEQYPLAERISKKLKDTKVGSGAVKFKASKGNLENYILINENDVSDTVMGQRRFIHPNKQRLLTVREQARLMGYPNHHILAGGLTSTYNQIGESVPPTLSNAIAKEVYKYLKSLEVDK